MYDGLLFNKKLPFCNFAPLLAQRGITCGATLRHLRQVIYVDTAQ